MSIEGAITYGATRTSSSKFFCDSGSYGCSVRVERELLETCTVCKVANGAMPSTASADAWLPVGGAGLDSRVRDQPWLKVMVQIKTTSKPRCGVCGLGPSLLYSVTLEIRLHPLPDTSAEYDYASCRNYRLKLR